MVKHFVLPVTGNMGMEQAQVTAGGIRTGEFSAHTLESRLCPGLYAAGEVLDIDGDCGGYNLQWAWSSGRLAGMLKGSL
jgi:predicted flavoprotein YhiN